MHPRNPYRTPVDFARLAVANVEFRKHCFLKSGKIAVDLCNESAVRSLTRAILLTDYELDVDIPDGSLVPRIPQKINYLLWIEDRLQENNIRHKDVIGIDIGTGSSAIYSLLGARAFGWRMIGVESDANSYEDALRNVKRNNMEKTVSERSDAATTFCVCNPPFFEEEEAGQRFVSCGDTRRNRCSLRGNEIVPHLSAAEEEEKESQEGRRREQRSLPLSATSARSNEVVVEGGEVGFISRLIEESAELKSRVKLYTTMLGKKSSVNALVRKLDQYPRLRYAIDSLNQGRTTRWLLAWTFDECLNLPSRKTSLLMLPIPVSTSLSRSKDETRARYLKWFERQLASLRIICKTVGEGIMVDGTCRTVGEGIMVCEAMKKTWTGRSRTEKRAAKRARLSNADINLQEDNSKGDEKSVASERKCEESEKDSGKEEGLGAGIEEDVEERSFKVNKAKEDDGFLLRFDVREKKRKSAEGEGHALELRLLGGSLLNLSQLVQYLKNRLPRDE